MEVVDGWMDGWMAAKRLPSVKVVFDILVEMGMVWKTDFVEWMITFAVPLLFFIFLLARRKDKG